MKTHFTSGFNKDLQKITSQDQKLLERIEKQLALFVQDPRHPSLRTHKLSGQLKNIWSLSINRSLRAVYVIENGTAVFTDIGTHDEVYRK